MAQVRLEPPNHHGMEIARGDLEAPVNRSGSEGAFDQIVQAVEIIGAPEGIRTPDLCLRRAALYPAELRARCA